MVSTRFLLPFATLISLGYSQRYLYSFGSSYTATGFDVNGRQPSKAFPFGNPPYGQSSGPSKPGVQGTAGGGPNYIDHLVATYNTSLTLSYNYAVGGTVVDASVVHGSAPDLVHQIPLAVTKRAPEPSDDIIFLIFMGDNDVQDAYKNGVPIDKLMDSYFSAVEELRNYNAYKFLLVTVPQLDRSPSHNLTHDSAEDIKKLANTIKDYNNALKTRADAYGKAHSDIQLEVYDFNAFMGKVLDQPKSYGFESATCEGDGPDAHCVWWKPSDEHTTSKFQGLMAKDISENVLKKFGW